MKTNILLLLLGFLAVSCLDDKTNYDYTILNEVKTIRNIERSYTLYPGETLTLEPELTFTLDSLHPDVSYEWYVELELVSKEPVYTYVADKVGTYYLTLVVTENNSKIKQTVRTYLRVDSEWKKGWLILSDRNNNSELSIVKTKSVELKGDDGYTRRDTLLIVDVDRNLNPTLGKGPIKLFEHFAIDDYGPLAQEIVVVQEDKCVELNGYTLEREIYTEEEFVGDVPAGFSPVDVAMTFKGNAVLNRDGLLYHSASSSATAYHTGRYSGEPYAQGKKFSNLAVGRGGKCDLIMAVMENGDDTRSFIGIVDDGSPSTNGDGDFGISHMYNGYMATLPQNGSSDDLLFNNLSARVLWNAWCGNDPDYGDAMFLALLKGDEGYYFLNYQFGAGRKAESDGTYKFTLEPYVAEKIKAPAGVFDHFSDIAVFPYRNYLVVASGNSLQLVNYFEGTAVPLNSFGSPVTSLAVRDFKDNWNEYEGPQLGVGLENGEFFIFEVDGIAGSLHQVYHADGFGVIRDVIYKYCSYINFYEGKYY